MEVNRKDFERFSVKLENCMNDMVEHVNVKFKKLDNKAVIPTYAHDGDVGADMTAIAVEYDELNDLMRLNTSMIASMNLMKVADDMYNKAINIRE